ncbi:MAG: MaoC family dehydratase [Brumimicrobium sp.]
MKDNTFGNYFEDFTVGEEIQHQVGKTIFESDNNLFSLLTMNHHPVHLDKNYAEEQVHGKILVVGTLVFSLGVGLTVADISGKAIANLGYEEIKHLHPTFIGDTIYARTNVLDKKASKSKPDRGIVSVITHVFNQDKKEVLSFKRSVLIKKKASNE